MNLGGKIKEGARRFARMPVEYIGNSLVAIGSVPLVLGWLSIAGEIVSPTRVPEDSKRAVELRETLQRPLSVHKFLELSDINSPIRSNYVAQAREYQDLMSKPEVAAGIDEHDKFYSKLKFSGKLMIYSMYPLFAGFGMLYFENRFRRRQSNYLFSKN